MTRKNKLLFIGALAFIAAGVLVSAAGVDSQKSKTGEPSSFGALVPVLRHPRCLNCHSAGDFPRQGDDGHVHAMNVRRGVEGLGVTAEKCTACHQDHNLNGLHLPPGAPGWRLPAAATPMVWQGHSDAEICRQIKDPKQNGNRSVEQIVEHMTEDKLVMWAWNPGEGRTAVPVSHDEFSTRVKAWAAAGAPCPAR